MILDVIRPRNTENATPAPLAPLLLLDGIMLGLADRLCLAIVVLGVILLVILCGHAYLPLSASGNFHRYERSRPTLPEWPHHGGLEDHA